MARIGTKRLLDKVTAAHVIGNDVTVTLTKEEYDSLIHRLKPRNAHVAHVKVMTPSAVHLAHATVSLPPTVQSRNAVTRKPYRRALLRFNNKPVAIQQNDEDFYSVQEVADLFNVTPAAVYKWVKKDEIQYERRSSDSRDIRIPKNQFTKREPKRERVVSKYREMFDDGKFTLSDPNEVFRTGEVEE